MMLADLLRDGFRQAHQRAGLIFLDILWKAIWAALTLAAFTLAVLWFTSDLSSTEWQDTGIPALNGLVASILLRDYWNAQRDDILIVIVTLVGVASLGWIVLEAFFRYRIVWRVSNAPAFAGLRPRSESSLKVFLASGAVKHAVFLASASVLLWVSYKGAAIIALVTFAALAFFLTLLDTLIRSDAVELLGTDLIRVAGLLGILMSFEGMVATSFLTILIAGFLNVAGPAGALMMLGAAVAVLVFLSLLHSYLLLVRFSAIAIMRQNVGEV